MLETQGEDVSDLSPEEVRKLVHELRTHQIELELQNEELRNVQVDLAESHDRYSNLYEFAPVGYITVSEKGLILEANLAFTAMLGVERRFLLEEPFSKFIVSEDQDIYHLHRRALSETKERGTCELRVRREEGNPLWVRMECVVEKDSDRSGIRFRFAIIDITKRRQAEEALEEARKLAESIVDTVREPLIVLDADLRVISASRAFYQAFQVSPEKTEGQSLYELGEKQWDLPKLKKLLEEVLPEKSAFNAFDDYEVEHEFPTLGRRIMLLNARRISRAANKPGLILLAIEDITERKRLEAKLRTLSIQDELTKLYNRRGFFALGEQQRKAAKREKKVVSILFADLDDMKRINDTLGHEKGNQALRETASILKKTFRESDIIARIGGDEFVVLSLLDSKNEAGILTSRLEKTLDVANRRKTEPYRLSLSVGMACSDPEHPCSLVELLTLADKHMYEQKSPKEKF
jgi:diguanylate cyclase (GGDEF)-like protein/PAS domain S-box-containing protein